MSQLKKHVVFAVLANDAATLLASDEAKQSAQDIHAEESKHISFESKKLPLKFVPKRSIAQLWQSKIHDSSEKTGAVVMFCFCYLQKKVHDTKQKT